MKKYIIIVFILAALYFLGDYAFYHLGWYVDLKPDAPVTTFTKTQGDQILIDRGNGYEPFEIKGVNMGSGIPGKWSTEFAIDEETYLRWFDYIKEMGANCIRIYTVQSDSFYNAFYEYNHGNEDPLYLIHGVWVNDYIHFSHRDAYAPEFLDQLIDDCRTMLDVIHGNKKISLGRYASAGHGTYRHDVSPWVIGYILGVEWEGPTAIFTDNNYADDPAYCNYQGEYMYTTEEATAFEAMLARMGDKVMEYESERYKTQRLLAFSNWPTTDPFDYPEHVARFFTKCAKVDTEHIRCTDAVLSGQFASYHVYPYFPDFLYFTDDWSELGIEDRKEFQMPTGEENSYLAYLTLLTEHHTMPVIISEFGIPTGRGVAHIDHNTNRNQGAMSEKEQGQALIACYEDIMAAGCAGSCVFSWQDEWFKRTWNTMYSIDSSRNPYWSDYQTNEQYFGLLAFDPGEEQCVCYVDGDISEWTEKDIASRNGDLTVSIKYDERYLYLMVNGCSTQKDTIYIPIDTTPKSGSSYCENYDLRFDRNTDFLVVIDGQDNSRLQVQERYEAIRSTYSLYAYGFDTYVAGNVPEVDSPKFVDIDMMLDLTVLEAMIDGFGNVTYEQVPKGRVYKTGLLTYGNGNPEDPDFNSMADYIFGDNCVEIRLPWQLLNFADPSRMEIHDDYYDGNYGVDYIFIEEMYVGVANGNEIRIPMEEVPLEGWENKVTYHERLKEGYYAMQSIWAND